MVKTDSGHLILEAAQRLFSRKGYHGTTIRDIAEERGILSGSIYAHIKSKEDLLFEITNRGADTFLEALESAISVPGTAVEQLERGMVAHILVIVEHLDAASVFFHEWNALSEDRRKVILEKRDRYESLWAKILHTGVENGEFRVSDLKFARILILTVINSMYQWYDPKGPDGPTEIAHHFTELILQGLVREREF
jgi:TetR/AcrR family transcriptional regulator, cholesterol catabolism regulator